jgi:cytochrome c biogenesis protein CcdA
MSDVSFAAAFGGGMLSFVSPCVLPLVPGYLSMISGISVTELAGTDVERPAEGDGRDGGVAVLERTQAQTRLHVLRATLLFVAGFTVVFTLLGLTATAIGQSLLEHRTILNRVAGAVLIVAIWLAGLSYAARHRQWFWLAGLLLLNPLWFLWYGTSVSDDFTYPEQWSAFADQPWYLLGLLITPIPLLAYGAARVWQDRA